MAGVDKVVVVVVVLVMGGVDKVVVVVVVVVFLWCMDGNKRTSKTEQD